MVISDRKLLSQTAGVGDATLIDAGDYFSPEVVSFSDNYPGGSIMPGRNAGSESYRYGYNKGSEKDDEITGVTGSHITTHFREYDTRLMRTWSIDPVEQAWQSPYASMDNNPIWFNDPLGNVAGKTGKEKQAKKDERGFRRENNSGKGLLNFSFTPMSYSQLLGSGKWKEQNNTNYVNPYEEGFKWSEFQPDEPSGIWAVNYTFFNSQHINLSFGGALSRIKGGLLSGKGNQEPHFAHGLGNLGGDIRVDYQFKVRNGINVSGFVGVTGGVAVAGFTDPNNENTQYSNPSVSFAKLDPKLPSWGTRGWGATAYAGINVSVGSSFFQKESGSDVFRVVIGVTYAIHAVRINSYKNVTTKTSYPSSSLVLDGVGVNVGVSIDMSWGH